MKIDCLIAQDKMKSRFFKIKCTAASDQVLNCQPSTCEKATKITKLVLNYLQ
jgi:hypothetical protein